jgi:hypothetical protein
MFITIIISGGSGGITLAGKLPGFGSHVTVGKHFGEASVHEG